MARRFRFDPHRDARAALYARYDAAAPLEVDAWLREQEGEVYLDEAEAYAAARVECDWVEGRLRAEPELVVDVKNRFAKRFVSLVRRRARARVAQ